MVKSPDPNKGKPFSLETNIEGEDGIIPDSAAAAAGEDQNSPKAASTAQAEIVTSTNTTTPPREIGDSPKEQGVQEAVAASPVAVGAKRRSGDLTAGAGGSSSSPKDANKPDNDDQALPFPCSICKKRFKTLKASCGHMRHHTERTWRGLNPPPEFSRDKTPDPVPLEEELTSTLSNIAQNEVAKLPSSSSSQAATAQGSKGLEIDLNIALQDGKGKATSPPSPAAKGFDLNKTSSSGSEDEDQAEAAP